MFVCNGHDAQNKINCTLNLASHGYQDLVYSMNKMECDCVCECVCVHMLRERKRDRE